MTIRDADGDGRDFSVKGWTAPAFAALAITIGGWCARVGQRRRYHRRISKPGFLIGATPRKQQIALLIACRLHFAIGGTLELMNKGLAGVQADLAAVGYLPPARWSRDPRAALHEREIRVDPYRFQRPARRLAKQKIRAPATATFY